MVFFLLVIALFCCGNALPLLLIGSLFGLVCGALLACVRGSLGLCAGLFGLVCGALWACVWVSLGLCAGLFWIVCGSLFAYERVSFDLCAQADALRLLGEMTPERSGMREHCTCRPLLPYKQMSFDTSAYVRHARGGTCLF